MSKEEYLKGEEKEKILEKLKKYLAFRLTTEEILATLKDGGINISERTLRRFKQELAENAGSTATEIFKNQVIANLCVDIYSYEQMQRECWKTYYDAQRYDDKLRALTILRNTASDKFKLLNNIPRSFRGENVGSKLKNLKKETDEIMRWHKKQIQPKIHS